MTKKSFPGKSLSSTQTSSSKGTPASGVVKQTAHALERGPRMNPPRNGAFGAGPGLSNTDTRNSPNVVDQVPNEGEERGPRQNPPRGAQFPGKGLANAQTRNSPTARR